MLEIVLIRHGKIIGAPNVYYGATDYTLSEEGRSQAIAGGLHLKNENFDRIYCSPLVRATESMRLFCDAANIDCSGALYDERLREMDFGIFEGKSYNYILENYPQITQKLEKDWLNFNPPSGERPGGFIERVAEFFTQLQGDSSGKVLIFCHAGVIRAAICSVLHIPCDAQSFWRYEIDYCKITRLRVIDGYGMIVQLNA